MDFFLRSRSRNVTCLELSLTAMGWSPTEEDYVTLFSIISRSSSSLASEFAPVRRGNFPPFMR